MKDDNTKAIEIINVMLSELLGVGDKLCNAKDVGTLPWVINKYNVRLLGSVLLRLGGGV